MALHDPVNRVLNVRIKMHRIHDLKVIEFVGSRFSVMQICSKWLAEALPPVPCYEDQSFIHVEEPEVIPII